MNTESLPLRHRILKLCLFVTRLQSFRPRCNVLAKQSVDLATDSPVPSPALLPALETRAAHGGGKASEVGHGLGDAAVAGGMLVTISVTSGPFLTTAARAGRPIGGLVRSTSAHRKGDGV
jgi:hypothetical protein